jgi:lipoprotein-releasing system permease protein
VNPAERLFLERYVSNPKRNLLRFSFVFMVLGIVISVGILSAALNLFEGYERTLRSVLLDSFAHIRIESYNRALMPDSLAYGTIKALSERPEIASATPLLTVSLMASNKGKARGSMMHAYGNGGANIYAKHVEKGSSEIKPGQVIAGHYLVKELGLSLGDTLRVAFPRLDRITPLGMYPGETPLVISGIYNSGFYEYDRSLLICGLEDARAIQGNGSGFSGIEVRLKDKYADESIRYATEFDRMLDGGIYAIPVGNNTLLRLVRMQKWLIFIVFSFLVLIAGINVISCVSAQIFDRKNEIAVLKSLGAGAATIRNILGYQLLLVCLAAIIAGQLFGLLLSWIVANQNIYQLKGDVYFIDRLEFYAAPFNQLVIFAVAALLVLLCVHIPLRRIDRMKAIDLLRNP